MNEANFVKRLNWIVTGDSFLKEMPLPLDAFRVASSGIPIGSGTAPTSTIDGVSYDDGNTSLLTFLVPMDYDQDGDRMILKLVVQPASADASTQDFGVLSTQSIFRPGSLVDATAATAEAESATSGTAKTVREVFLSLSSGAGGYQPGDVLRRTIDANNSSTVEAEMLAASIIYGSSFAAYNDDDRFRDASLTTGD